MPRHASDERSSGAVALLASYSRTHGAGAAASSGVVVGVYGCPAQLGNRIHEFLNAFALAVVTNRTLYTLVWQYTAQPG